MDAGKGAMTIAGSWTINTYLGDSAKVKFAFAPLPAGPQGRKTAINGLSDAIWAGTKHKDEAWKWVKFLASADCQNIVGGNGVVFPAIKSASDKALAAHKAKGRDVQAVHRRGHGARRHVLPAHHRPRQRDQPDRAGRHPVVGARPDRLGRPR